MPLMRARSLVQIQPVLMVTTAAFAAERNEMIRMLDYDCQGCGIIHVTSTHILGGDDPASYAIGISDDKSGSDPFVVISGFSAAQAYEIAMKLLHAIKPQPASAEQPPV